MSKPTSDVPLTSTLTLALAQCQDQVRLLDERAQVITNLQEENEKLKLALDDARSQSKKNDSTEEHKALFETLYQKDAEKQVQIDELKAKLRRIKIRAQLHGLNSSFSSSPLPSSNEKDPSVQKSKRRVPSPPASEGTRGNFTTPGSTSAIRSAADPPESMIPPQRARSQSPISTRPPLEATRHAKIAIKEEGDRSAKRKRLSDRGEAAIPSIAEDGEHLWNSTQHKVGHKTNEAHTSVYHRLNELMNAPTPQRSALARANHGRQIDGLVMKDRSHTANEPIAARINIDASAKASRRTRKPLATELSVVPLPNFTSKDQEPLRLRPPEYLDLSHFKLNPTVNGGLDYAYNEVVRGRQERNCLPGCTKPECCGYKFSVLADTLPKLPSAQGMSDDDLLIQHLGPGSEERIRTLTAAARENLLHDARTKLIANAYGKMHRNLHERGRSPPGFWSTDMPGSQEEEGLRKQAKAREREVVQRRYEEAMRGDGRWIFADE